MGQLVLQVLGGGAHALAEILLGDAQVAVEDVADLLDVGVVGGFILAGNAGGVAVADLQLEAGLELAGFDVGDGEVVVAGAERVEGADELQEHVEGGAVGIGAVVARAVGDFVAGRDEAGEPLVGEAEVGVGFAILQQDVVLGLVLLDEVVFEQESVGFAVDDGKLQALDVADQLLGFLVVVLLGEVAAHALAQVDGLAHVNDALVVEILVHAGLVGQGVDLGLQFGFGGHERKSVRSDVKTRT